MNTQSIVDELKRRYPRKKIIFHPTDEPSEIVCEIESTEDYPERSVVMAIVGKSEPHYHKISTEIYKATKGILTVYKDGKKYVLQEGEQLIIKPGSVHYAEGDDVWFLTISEPGWTKEDHVPIKEV